MSEAPSRKSILGSMGSASFGRKSAPAPTDAAKYRDEQQHAEDDIPRVEGQDAVVPDVDLEDEDEAEDEAPASNGPRTDANALIDEEERAAQQQRSAAAQQTQHHSSSGKRSDRVGTLTPVQRHYLIKALVSLQMQTEWSELEKLGALTQYGFPFALERPKTRVKKELDMDSEFAKGEFAAAADDPYADEDAARRAENLQEPLITRHMFHVHLKPFPGLNEAPVKYWQKRIQPFFDEMASRNFSTSIERSEISSRRFYTLAFTRYLGGFFSRGVGVRGEGELRGPGKGEPGSDKWGLGKQWGKGTVKRGLDQPARIDAQLMERVDNLFQGREQEVWRRAGKEVDRVRNDWRAFKEFVIESESGLEEVMAYLQVGNIKNLPPRYRNAEEWARHHAAYIFHTLFVTSPASESIFGVLKGIHALFPYWGAKQLLKVANAEKMISGILGLLLARPAGSKSLLQRMFTFVIGKEASAITKTYLQPFRKEINDADLTKKIEEYVKRASRPEGRAIRARAERTGDDVLTTILLFSSGLTLSKSKQDHVLELQRAFVRSPYISDLNLAYPRDSPAGKAHGKSVPSWGAGAQEAIDAKKFALLKLHLRECLHKRDREQAVAFASGSLIPTIIKDSLTIVFYGYIKQIADVADLADRLGDLQAFIDDILKMKKKKQDTLPDFVGLCARHENSIYMLFHECHSIMQPFTEWLQAGDDFMALGTTDPLNPANRNAKNIEVNVEELLQDDRLAPSDVDAILKETDQLAAYVKWQKTWYEIEMRKNFIFAPPAAQAASGLSEDDIPPGPMRQQVLDVDGLLRRVMEAEGVPIEDGVVRSITRGTEMADFAWAWFDRPDPVGQHIAADNEAPELRFQPGSVSAPIPSMDGIRKALPAFRDVLLDVLPRWRETDSSGVAPSADTRSGSATPATTRAPTIAGTTRTNTTKKSAPPSVVDNKSVKKKGGLGGLFRKG